MFAVVDFETTDITQDRRAMEIGIVILDENFNEVEAYESVINPQRTAGKRSLSHAGMIQKELDAAPTFIELWPDIARLISAKFLVMHNDNFDKQVFYNEFEAMGENLSLSPSICTLQAAKRVYPELRAQGDLELSSLIEFLGLEIRAAHQALSDARMTADLLKEMFPRDRDTLRMVEVLKDSLVTYEFKRSSVKPAPRERLDVQPLSDNELRQVALEISRNRRVLEAKHVCMTGTLESETEIAEALAEVGFELLTKETTKSTAFLLVGSKPGVRKINKALGYERPIVLAHQAMDLISHLKETLRR